MRTLQHFRDFVNEIMESNSRLHKQAVLKKYKDDEVIKKYLQIAFDPYQVFGISTKKLNKEVTVQPLWPIGCGPTVLDFFNYLEKHNSGKDADIMACQQMLDEAASKDIECAELLEKLICKDLTIGVDKKSVNQVIPNLVPEFNVMLAQKFFEKPEKLEGREFAVTTKIDGGRIIAIKENGQVSFFTRAGQKYEGLVELEQEMLDKLPDGLCLDGEITLFNNKGIPSKLAYKETMKLTRKDGPKTGLKMLVFDAMPVEEFKAQHCKSSWSDRRYMIESVFGYAKSPLKYFELLPVLYRGTDTSMVTKLLNEAIANQEEGVMLSLVDEPYQFSRTWALMKVKKMNDIDLEVVGFEPGSGRLAGTLGALLVRYKNNNIVKVGSGFSDELRKEIWENQADWLGAICSIQYFESSINSTTGLESLRFPVFLERRTDKLEADC